MEPGISKVVTKAEFSKKIGISPTTRQRLLNITYFKKIKRLGYRKTSRVLNAAVLKFLYNELCYTEESD